MTIQGLGGFVNFLVYGGMLMQQRNNKFVEDSATTDKPVYNNSQIDDSNNLLSVSSDCSEMMELQSGLGITDLNRREAFLAA